MKNKLHVFAIGCCAVIFCAASGYAQYDTCAWLKRWDAISPNDQKTYMEKYDSLRAFVEHCAETDSRVSIAFTDLDGTVQFMSSDTTRFDQYRSWLLSVLYLPSIDPIYFCVCMGSIAGTYQYGKYNPSGYFAVLDYLRKHHPNC